MTLQASGTISMGNITTEMGAANTQTNVGGSSPRTLAAKPSGIIKWSDFYGKTAIPAYKLWVWGSEGNGQLGDNLNTGARSIPAQNLTTNAEWVSLAANTAQSAGVKADGTLWTWGYDNYGQLGIGSLVSKSSAVQTIAGGTNWKQASCGNQMMSAVKTDGTLWCWGYGAFGSMGDNTNVSKSSPVQTITGGTNWSTTAVGYSTVYGIKTDGTLWCWGRNSSGGLGDNTVVNRSSPVQTVTGGTNWSKVSSLYMHVAAIKTDGTLWLWGINSSGQLGNGTTTNRSSPAQTVAGGTNWSQVAAGQDSTSAIKTDGTLWSWGINTYGQLGDNTVTSKSSPVQTVAGGTTWSKVAVGSHVAAIKTDGTLWLWGQGGFGHLGDGTLVHKSSPVQTVAGGTNWKLIACGYRHTLAAKP